MKRPWPGGRDAPAQAVDLQPSAARDRRTSRSSLCRRSTISVARRPDLDVAVPELLREFFDAVTRPEGALLRITSDGRDPSCGHSTR
jgi:hypothetical protein